MAGNYRANGFLIQNTGIGAGNYPYFEPKNKQSVDDWFQKQVIKFSFENYTAIPVDPVSKNSYNLNAVNIDAPYEDVLMCDYISFQNIDQSAGDSQARTYYGMITSREYVSANATRVYFAIDWVASFWDTIELGNCLVERDHTEYGVYENMLPEPFSYVAKTSHYSGGHNLESAVADYAFDYKFTAIASIKSDGTYDAPKMRFQAGASMGGMVHVGDQGDMEGLAKVYTTFSNLPLADYQNFLNSIKVMYVSPTRVANSTSAAPLQLGAQDIPLLGLGDIGCSHNKVLNLITYSMGANDGIMQLPPWQYSGSLNGRPAPITVQIWATGGYDGHFKFMPMTYDEKGSSNAVSPRASLNSGTWGAVSVAGVVWNSWYGINRGNVQVATSFSQGGSSGYSQNWGLW